MFARSSFPPRSAPSDSDPLDPVNALDSWKRHQRTLLELVYPSVKTRVSEARKKAMKSFKDHKRIIKQPFPLGSMVMVYNTSRDSKTDQIYLGPCKVIHVIRNQSYTVVDNSGRILPKIPISHLKLVSRLPITRAEGGLPCGLFYVRPS